MVRVIDAAAVFATGKRYEDVYGGWLSFFQDVSKIDPSYHVTVLHAPWSWIPLLWYLRCDIREPINQFPECSGVRGAISGYYTLSSDSLPARIIDRHLTEVLCSFRPETVDALWKVDAQWKPARSVASAFKLKNFPVTCNGSFWRPEVMHFIDKVLPAYTPVKRKAVLVPCAADKPYPAPLHEEVLKRLPDDYYLAIATGVLGIVPQDLWEQMPHYDSGIPNEWRLMQIAETYFKKHEHDFVVPYLDFYSLPVSFALMRSGTLEYEFVNPVRHYDDYLDLLAPERLDRLSEIITTHELKGKHSHGS